MNGTNKNLKKWSLICSSPEAGRLGDEGFLRAMKNYFPNVNIAIKSTGILEIRLICGVVQ